MSNWWSRERIEATVNPDFITKKLSPRHRALLRSPVAFGQGLTDGTYLDWILARGPRLFLILDDIGCPEHIFEIVDKSYDDSDLPLSTEAISDLKLAHNALERKFARRQNAYNVQELWEGSHVEYGDGDYVPVESAPKTKGSATSGRVDRVIVRNKLFAQRCMKIGEDTGIDKVHLVLHFRILQKLKYPHLVSVWATYIHKEQGFLLLQPSLELTLKTFLEDTPKSFKQLPRTEQCELLLQWIRCLGNALSFLHQNGYSHQAIRPSNILIDNDNHIYLGAYQALGALEDQEPAYEKDTYEHAAPEKWQRKPSLAETNPLRSTLQGGGRTGYRIKGHRSQSSNSSSSRSSKSVKAQLAASDGASSVVATNAATASRSGSRSGPASGSGSSGRNSGVRDSAVKHLSGLASPGLDLAALSTNSCRPSHTIISTLQYKNPEPARDLYDQSPYFQCDVFSISVIFIEILSFLASIAHQSSKLSPSSLRSHLGKHNRTAGRGGAPADSSFHANLRQTNLWLDVLSQSDNVSSNKLTAVFRKNNVKGKTPQQESENWRCKGALGNLSDLFRPNVCKEPKQRYTALETVLRIDTIYERWGISKPKCCPGVNRSPSQAATRESMITALHMPRSATASSVDSKWSARPGRAGRSSGGQSHASSISTSTARPPDVAEEGPQEDGGSVLTYTLDDPDAERDDDSDAESLIIPIDEIVWPSPHSSRPSTSHFAGSQPDSSYLRSHSTLLPERPDTFLSSQSTLTSLPGEHASSGSRRSPSGLAHRSPPPSSRLPPTPAAGSRWPMRLDSQHKSTGLSSGYASSSASGSASSSSASTPAPSVGGAPEETFRPFWRETRFATVNGAGTAPQERHGGARRRGMVRPRTAAEGKRYSVMGGDDVPPVPRRAPGHQAPKEVY